VKITNRKSVLLIQQNFPFRNSRKKYPPLKSLNHFYHCTFELTEDYLEVERKPKNVNMHCTKSGSEIITNTSITTEIVSHKQRFDLLTLKDFKELIWTWQTRAAYFSCFIWDLQQLHSGLCCLQ